MSGVGRASIVIVAACAAAATATGADENGTVGSLTRWELASPVVVTHPQEQVASGGAIEVVFLPMGQDPEGDVPRELTFTPDGCTVVIVNRDTDNMTFLNVDARTITHTVALRDFPVDVAVTPDGALAVAPNVFDNTVSVVDIATYEVLAHVPITGDEPFRVAIAPDGRHAVVGVINDAVNSAFSVIDLQALEEVLVFPTAPQGVIGGSCSNVTGICKNVFTQFALLPDGITILLPVPGQDRVVLYDRTDGSELASVPVGNNPELVDVSPDGTTALIGHSLEPLISRIDLVTRVVDRTYTTPAALRGSAIRITPDRTFGIAGMLNETLFVNLGSGADTVLSTGRPNDLEISFDGAYAFVSNLIADVVEIDSRIVVKTLAAGWAEQAATSPTERRAVAVNTVTGDDIHLYDIDGANGFVEGSFRTGELEEGDATRGVALSPDESTLVAMNLGSDNLTFVDLVGDDAATYVEVGDEPVAIAYGADGAHVAVVRNNGLTIVDPRIRARVADLAIPGTPRTVRISPDGRRAYVGNIGSSSDRVYFIDLDGGSSSIVDSLIVGNMGTFVYTFIVSSEIDLSPDGSVLAACSTFTNQLTLVDTASRAEITRLTLPDRPMQVEFSTSGTRAYVASTTGDALSVVRIDGERSAVESVADGIGFPLTVNPDAADEYVYVGSWDDDTIVVVDVTGAASVVQTIPLPGNPRAAHLSDSESILYVATTDGSFHRIDAAGPESSLIDSVPLTGAPADLAFSDRWCSAFVAEPIPDGVDRIGSGPPCSADLNGSGAVDFGDILAILSAWGNTGGPEDLDGSGTIDFGDILVVLGAWGSCPRACHGVGS